MADDPRRFDDVVRTVADLRRQLSTLQATVLNRVATHTHANGGLVLPPPAPVEPVLPAGYAVLPASSTATAGTALNAAIAALPATGGTILVPAGTWTLDAAALVTKSGLVFRGVSGGASRLRFDGATIPAAIANADTTQRYVTVQDLGIESTTDGAGTAIDASYLVTSQFERLRIGNAGASPNQGIVFDAIGTYYNTVRDCRIQVAGSGSRCLSFDNIANSNWVDNVRLHGDANTTGVYVNAHAVTLAHVDCETTMAIGVDIDALGHDCMVLAPYLEAVDVGLQLASGVECVTVAGGVIIDCDVNNIVDNGAASPVFLNTRVQYAPYTSFGGVLGMADQPSAPATDGVLYRDAGALKWRGGSGTVTTIAPA